jgi:SAM-dependent methyltransferase
VRTPQLTDWHDPNLIALAYGMALPFSLQRPVPAPLSHRKVWEWVTISSVGVDSCHALGIGVGTEPLVRKVTGRCSGYVVATDLYDDLSAEVAITGPRILVMRADARNLPFADDTFDLVWSSSSLEHVGTSSDIHRAQGEAARVLHKRGRYVLTTEYLYNPGVWKGVARDNRPGILGHAFTWNELLDLVIGSEFAVTMNGRRRSMGWLQDHPLEVVPEHAPIVFEGMSRAEIAEKPLIWLRAGGADFTSILLDLQKV